MLYHLICHPDAEQTCKDHPEQIEILRKEFAAKHGVEVELLPLRTSRWLPSGNVAILKDWDEGWNTLNPDLYGGKNQ